jgi:hypothetical protein
MVFESGLLKVLYFMNTNVDEYLVFGSYDDKLRSRNYLANDIRFVGRNGQV